MFWTCKQIETYNENADIPFGINTEQPEVWYFAWWKAFLGLGLGQTSNF